MRIAEVRVLSLEVLRRIDVVHQHLRQTAVRNPALPVPRPAYQRSETALHAFHRRDRPALQRLRLSYSGGILHSRAT